MHQNSKYIITYIFVGILAFTCLKRARSQDGYRLLDNTDAFTSSMEKASSTTNSIVSEFEQIKHLSFLEEDVKSRGVFYFRKENKLRWEYNEPFHYLIMFSNDTVLIQDENKTSIYDASSGRMFREINEIMLSMVNGSILKSDKFEIEYFENTTSYKLELTPLEENMQEFLSNIHIYINKNDLSADELYMIERSDDFTHIRFINKRLNEEIPDHIFDLP